MKNKTRENQTATAGKGGTRRGREREREEEAWKERKRDEGGREKEIKSAKQLNIWLPWPCVMTIESNRIK